MNLLSLELVTIAVLTALNCTIPGVFLVLRGVSLMSDAISHALLLGIVVAFFIVRSLTSPLLLVGAAVAGFAVVMLTEYAMQQFKLHKDAAIGLFFPFFFSVAVILISVYTRDAHLDTDMVLLGDMVFAPFSRCIIGGIDCGPQAISMLIIIGIITVSVWFFLYKPLVMSIFDPVCARSLKIPVEKIYYIMMFLSSVVAVAAFSVVGSVVVVALMIAPAATAYCTARSVNQMVLHAAFFSICAAIGGYYWAAWADLSIAGSIATMTGFIFALVVLGAPKTGIVGKLWHYGIAWLEKSLMLVTAHNANHAFEVDTVMHQFCWTRRWTLCVVQYGMRLGRLRKYQDKFYVNNERF